MPARPHAAHGLELRQKEFLMKTEKQLARAYGELAQRLTGKRFLTASGLTRKEAAAQFTTEERFQSWLKEFRGKLEESIQ